MSDVGTIAIVGTGALGGYVGAHLAKDNNSVRFLVRRDYDALKQHGFHVRLVDAEDFTVPAPKIFQSPSEIGHVDLVIVALKTTQNESLAQLLPPLVGEHTQLLTIQNGLGNVERLSALFPQNKVLGGLCQIGVDREAPGRLVSYVPGGGSIQVGAGAHATMDDVDAIATMLKDSGLKTRSLESLGEALWRKLMWNVPFNGLTVATGGHTTDHIVGTPALRELSTALMNELVTAANALGFPIESSFTEKQIGFTDKLGAYPPSSLVDWRAKRPIEVEAIWGEPLRQGASVGVEMPHLQTLHAILEGLNASLLKS
jgi:2-dehydropantoate 2-reductase|tara:strand:- start:8180 stop:9121 length:942 start_codon:yes stop_codon:yes gene_type:complete